MEPTLEAQAVQMRIHRNIAKQRFFRKPNDLHQFSNSVSQSSQTSEAKIIIQFSEHKKYYGYTSIFWRGQEILADQFKRKSKQAPLRVPSSFFRLFPIH